MKRSYFFIFLALFVLLQAGCQESLEGPEALVGNWKATWEYAADRPLEDSMSYKMEGLINFNPEGLVDIRAYGHPTCAFLSDTTKNIMKWSINSDKLYLSNQRETFVFSYTIESYNHNFIELDFSGVRLKMARL